jgi:hypothetical protein
MSQTDHSIDKLKSKSKNKINNIINSSLFSDKENKSTINQINKTVNFSKNQKNDILKENNRNTSINKKNKSPINKKNNVSKIKKINNSIYLNSREDKNFVRNIFNNVNHNKDFEENIIFSNNYSTVKISATCVSTKDNRKDDTNSFQINEINHSKNNFLDYYNINNTKNALINYTKFNKKNNFDLLSKNHLNASKNNDNNSDFVFGSFGGKNNHSINNIKIDLIDKQENNGLRNEDFNQIKFVIPLKENSNDKK